MNCHDFVSKVSTVTLAARFARIGQGLSSAYAGGVALKMVSRTHRGWVRVRNEDAVSVNESQRLAMLADGMGGLFAGRLASRLALDSVAQFIAASDIASASMAEAGEAEIAALLIKSIEHAHACIIEYSQALEMGQQMGTTIVLWYARGDRWVAAHVGDSRLYLVGAAQIVQLTKDHSLGQRMLDEGEIEDGVDVLAQYGHILTQGLGLKPTLKPELCSGLFSELSPGDRFLLCSDGLSTSVADDILGTKARLPDIAQAGDELLQSGLDYGGKDNISLVLIDLP